MAIFKIPNEAQFDLKSVVLKNNLVQIYNFDQAQENSIPIKHNDKVVWVNRDTLLADAGFNISAEGSFDILDLNVITDVNFESVSISDALDIDDQIVPNAIGPYTSTPDINVWTRTVDEDVYTATYDIKENKWTLINDNVAFKSFNVQAVNNVTKKVSLIENKKQKTVFLENTELIVYIPESTGELAYSKIIWKLLTADEPPILKFMTASEGKTVDVTNIIWEYADDYKPSPNVNNFYVLETWDYGANWFGKVTRLGRTTHEINEEFLKTNYYTKSEIDVITSWEIKL